MSDIIIHGNGKVVLHRPAIGLQGTVMAWDDPWHTEKCSSWMRTGESKIFPSQDPTPTRAQFLSLLQQWGVDFYLHHGIPDEQELLALIEDMKDAGMPFILGNEYGNINGIYTERTNRYDLPAELIKQAQVSGLLRGVIYDEPEHLQLHPQMYTQLHKQLDGNTVYHFANPTGCSLAEAEEQVEQAARAITKLYPDVPVYSEHVFPVMYHTLARAGFHPCPKVMKEAFQPLQLASALGAAKQYNRSLGICVDLWGQDVGPWFTRLWGFPGHSPREFQSALELAYWMAPEMMFVENVDPLAISDGTSFHQTEFGAIYAEFIQSYVPGHPLPYSHRSAQADIAIIRSDDTDIVENMNGKGHRGLGGYLYGSPELPGTSHSRSVYDVFHLVSHGTLPRNGNTFYVPQYPYPSSSYARTRDTMQQLPLHSGVPLEEQTQVHGLFYPMNNVLVFDPNVTSAVLGQPKVIVLAGSRMNKQCLDHVAACVRAGALCIAACWLLPANMQKSRLDGLGQWLITDDFLSAQVQEAIRPHLGASDCWTQRFGDYELRITNPSGDGITLSFKLEEVI